MTTAEHHLPREIYAHVHIERECFRSDGIQASNLFVENQDESFKLWIHTSDRNLTSKISKNLMNNTNSAVMLNIS